MLIKMLSHDARMAYLSFNLTASSYLSLKGIASSHRPLKGTIKQTDKQVNEACSFLLDMNNICLVTTTIRKILKLFSINTLYI